MLDYMSKYCESVRQDENGEYVAILKPEFAVGGLRTMHGDGINNDGWVTINGAHVLIDDTTFKVIGGAGGKFNGKVFSPKARAFFGKRKIVKKGQGYRTEINKLNKLYDKKVSALANKIGSTSSEDFKRRLAGQKRMKEWTLKNETEKLASVRDRVKKLGVKGTKKKMEELEREARKYRRAKNWYEENKTIEELHKYDIARARKKVSEAKKDFDYATKSLKRAERYLNGYNKLMEEYEDKLNQINERHNKGPYKKHQDYKVARKSLAEDLRLIKKEDGPDEVLEERAKSVREHIRKKYSDPVYANSEKAKALDEERAHIWNRAEAIRDPRGYAW